MLVAAHFLEMPGERSCKLLRARNVRILAREPARAHRHGHARGHLGEDIGPLQRRQRTLDHLGADGLIDVAVGWVGGNGLGRGGQGEGRGEGGEDEQFAH